MPLPKIVQDWNPEDGPLSISGAEYVLWHPAEVDSFNAWLLEKRQDGNFLVGREGDTFLIRKLQTIGHVFSGAPDARQATTAGAADGGPFRRRYRTLSIDEVKHHDLIKDKASELWAAIEGIPDAREDPDPTVARDIALAKTHLEDSVMRAVRALTA